MPAVRVGDTPGRWQLGTRQSDAEWWGKPRGRGNCCGSWCSVPLGISSQGPCRRHLRISPKDKGLRHLSNFPRVGFAGGIKPYPYPHSVLPKTDEELRVQNKPRTRAERRKAGTVRRGPPGNCPAQLLLKFRGGQGTWYGTQSVCSSREVMPPRVTLRHD